MSQKRPCSKRVRERDIIREHLIHKEKLCRVSSRIDNASPRCMSHVQKNLKGKFIEKARKNEIISSNKMLVNKLLKVNARDNSMSRVINHSNFLMTSKKIEEIGKITNENYRILNKIKTSKPYYSSDKLKRQYRYATTLKNMISKNSGRVPKILNYTQIELPLNIPASNKSARSLQNSGKFEYFI